MLIPQRIVNDLLNAGLVVSDPFVSDHFAFPGGIVVGKPASAIGNSLIGFDGNFGDDEILIDAPPVYFHFDEKKWIVTSHDFIPGPGPADFRDEWDSAEEAVVDILDFYFGIADRMKAKASAMNLQMSGKASEL